MPDIDAPLGTAQASVEQGPRRIRRRTILILGVLVIPVVLSLSLNSYGPLTEESALRMAAATVVGQTIAILSAITAVVLTIKRRQSLVAITIIAALVIGASISSMNAAGETLITRLDRIAQIDRVHQQ